MGKLLTGIGNSREIRSFYDKWSDTYDESLNQWNYKAPRQSALILKRYIKNNPKYLLDLACGTGLFAQEIGKIFPNIICDGTDISKKIINISLQKNLYRNLYLSSFEKNIRSNDDYNVVSLIGGMTYCKNYQLLFELVYNYLKNRGYFIFTHRIDIWEKLNFDDLLKFNENKFEIIYISKPLKYLPENKDFGNKVKIKIVLLSKKKRAKTVSTKFQFPSS
tara:strand:+ start:54 stop:713 length:660 start_codon:yes stop_codon:yes gene_type:complete